MVALPGLDKSNRGTSTRAANAGYCVNDEEQGRVRSASTRAVRPAGRGGSGPRQRLAD